MPQSALDKLLEGLPHREPFRFVSSVEELEAGRHGAGTWRISGDEEFFRGHFPGDPVVPGVLLAEALAQLSGLVASAGDVGSAGGPGRLAQVDVKFQSAVVPPAEVRLHSSLTREMSGLFLFDVRAEVRGAAVARGSLVLASVSVAAGGSGMIGWELVACSAVCAGLAGQPALPSPRPSSTATEGAAKWSGIASERLAKRLEAVDAAMAKVSDLRADFEQHRRTPLLKKPLVSRGVVLTKGQAVRWNTTVPRASSLVIGQGSISMYYPSDNLLEEYPMGEGFADLAGAPLPRLAVLRERFEITALSPADLGASDKDANLLAVALTPKSDRLREHVTSVKVLIDESRPAATKVVMTAPDGDETEIVFHNVVLNGGVKDEEMELKLPEGVRVSRPLGERKNGDGAGVGESDRAPGANVRDGSR